MSIKCCRMVLPKKLASLQADKIALQEGQRQLRSEGNFEAQTSSRFALASMMVLPLQTGVTPSQQMFQITAGHAISSDWTRGFKRSKIKNNLAYTRHLMKNKSRLSPPFAMSGSLLQIFCQDPALRWPLSSTAIWLAFDWNHSANPPSTDAGVRFCTSFSCIYDPVWWNISKT